MRRVLKIGGSLLKSPDLCSRLSSCQLEDTPADTLAIVGGGDIINAVREIDQVAELDAAKVHWICVDLLTQTFNLMKQRVKWPVIETTEQLLRWMDGPPEPSSTTLVRVDTFYRPQAFTTSQVDHQARLAKSPVFLPENWQTTTDSIAALLAQTIDATELMLLKSCKIPQKVTLNELAEQGVVDHAFPQASKGIERISIRRLGSKVSRDETRTWCQNDHGSC